MPEEFELRFPPPLPHEVLEFLLFRRVKRLDTSRPLPKEVMRLRL